MQLEPIIWKQTFLIRRKIVSIVYGVIELKHIYECSKQLLMETKRKRITGKERRSTGKLCNRLKFVYVVKLYMYKPESVQANVTHKLLWNFEIQIDYEISVKRPDHLLINK